ncbi:unnamed protein product [Camellia sinensis]
MNRNRNGHGGGPGPGEGSGAELLINTAEYFLRNRNLDGCRKYAVQAQESNPNAAAQILAVVDVLAAATTRFNNNNNNRPDWYSILGVKRYSEDLQLLRNQYKKLILLLNPNKNNSPFALEAFDLVRHAWTLLSNPLKKNQFDNELRMFFESQTKTKQPLDKMKKQKTKTKTESSSNSTSMEGGQCGSDSDTFWTVCPYCYYVYEYVRVYEDCCLRCQNHTCMRAFHAVAIRSPPPPAVVRNGEYWCLGFNPIGFQNGGGDKGKGFSSWMPFAPMFTATPHEEEEEVVVVNKNSVPPQGGNESNIGNNSDNSSDDELLGKTEENASGKNLQTEQVKKGVESFDGCTRKTFHHREVPSPGPSPSPSPSPSVAKPVMKRKKSVARNTKKIMGKGTRIKKDETIPEHVEGSDWDTDDASKDYEDFGSGIAEGMETLGSSRGQSGTGMDGLQFFDGEDDDIFVGLQDGFF